MLSKVKDHSLLYLAGWLATFVFAMFIIAAQSKEIASLQRELATSNVANLHKEIAERTKDQSLLSGVIHRMWIDYPSEFSLMCAESAEWEALQEEHKGFFEDTFLYWSKEDSIEYVKKGGLQHAGYPPVWADPEIWSE